MSEARTGLIDGFKTFVLKGSVVDLAVAVVVAAAVTTVIASFTENIIDPVVAAFGGGDLSGVGFCVRSGGEPCTSESLTFVDIGALFSVLVAFVITMAVVYFLFVKPINRVRAMAGVEQEAGDAAPPPEVMLLTEIRDLLAVRDGDQNPGPEGRSLT